jgi:hypothetical protein
VRSARRQPITSGILAVRLRVLDVFVALTQEIQVVGIDVGDQHSRDRRLLDDPTARRR